MLKKFTVHIDSNPDSGGVSVFATHFLKYLDYFDLNYEQRNVSRPVWQGVNIYTVLYVHWLFLLKRRDVYVVIHDLQHRTHPKNFSIYQRLVREIKIWLVSLLKLKIITESGDVEKMLYEIYRIQHITKITCFFPDNVRPIQENSLSGDSLNLFYPAKGWPHKRVEELIEWVKTYNLKSSGLKVKLHLTNVSQAFASEYVEVHGLVTSDRLIALYDMADLVYINSESESVSLPVFEAWQLGKPVACSTYVWSISQSQNGRLTYLNISNDYLGFETIINQLQTKYPIEMIESSQNTLLKFRSKFWL